MSRLTGAGLWWSPRRLGRSLPLYRRLWLARAVAAALIVLAGVLVWSLVRRSLDPRLDGSSDTVLDAAAAERLVTARLARLEVGHWTPGAPLPETAAPAWLEAPVPPLASGPHPAEAPLAGRAAELSTSARRDHAEGRPEAAATRFLRAAEARATWQTRYNAGLALLALGDPQEALRQLAAADDLLDTLEEAGAGGAAHHAIRIASRQAAGQAALAAGNCLGAIGYQRLAVSSLRGYVDAEGALVHDRKWPFPVPETGVDNHAVWSSLARAYARCDDRFPHDYPSVYGAQRFDAEYRTADLEEVAAGPFAAGIAACVTAAAPPSRCWAWSNLNQVLWASRSHLPLDDHTAPAERLSDALAGSLARLVYNAAWLAATSEHEADRRGAGRWLQIAARLDRRAEVDDLARRISALGRHLAPLTGDHSTLAETWRRRDLEGQALAAELPPEDLKGIAWALSERWRAELAARRPGAMIEAIDEQTRRAGAFGESLQAWKGTVQAAMREALATEIDLHRRNDNLPAALAIRDFRAHWLGDPWPHRAARAWRSPAMIARWVALAALWVLFAAAVALVHRLVVFPYLVYTTDGYRLEHRRRHAQRKTAGKPFTRDEIEGRA